MPLSPSYNPVTSFANDETNTVAGRSTVRTVALDTELANIGSSINGAKTNLEKLQRDDGKLKDFIVEPYALSEQARALVASGGEPKGIWIPGENYQVGDVVQDSGFAFICYTAHTSTSPFATNGLWIGISGDGSANASALAAAASQTAAATSATTATTQAGIAATQAGASTAQAGIATTQATASANSASAALTSQSAAAASAASASAAATASATSQTAAAASAASASTSANTATTQAGIATAQAANALYDWGYTQSFRIVSATRNSDGAITTATIAWPDGTAGVFTATTISPTFPGATDAWSATYAGTPAKTVTQAAVTRDAEGAVTAQPAITVT